MNIMDKIEETIDKYGWQLIGVFPDAKSRDPVNEAFIYTIGNADKGLPELLFIGSYGEIAACILKALSCEMIDRGRPFEDGEFVDIGDEERVYVCKANDSVKDDIMVQATNYNGHGYDVMQVVSPDLDGKFPWELGCAKPYANVKIHRAASSPGGIAAGPDETSGKPEFDRILGYRENNGDRCACMVCGKHPGA